MGSAEIEDAKTPPRPARFRSADPRTDARAFRGAPLLAAFAFAVGLSAPLLRATLGTAPVRPPAPRAAPDRRPNFLLITIDTLRPDALGWVAGKNETPAIDRLASEGARFPGAVSPVPLTLPAHVSILTGLLPRRHGVRDNGQTLPAGIETLAGRLKGKGYTTAAFVSGYPLAATFGLDRGFALYDDRLPEGSEGWLERKAFDTTTAVVAWLAKARSPWFLWVHYYDPHDPYEPPRSFWRPGPRGAYDGEVAYVDAWIAKLREGIPPPAAQNLLTILSGDHGEALGEHRERTHGYFLYDATVRVPLVVHFPGRLKPAESRAPVRLIDLAPTALDLLGQGALPGTDGASFRALLEGKPWTAPPAYLETRLPWVYFGWAPLSALRTADAKLIAAPRPELYDLAKDPGEAANRIDDDRKTARSLIEATRAIEKRPAAGASAAADPEAAARLRALGYLGAGGAPGEPPAGLPDPKDRVELRDRLQDAEAALREGNLAEALRGFDAVLATEPSNRFATLRSGTALLKAGRAEEAAARLAKAVALDPGRAEARYALGDALMRLGRFREAVPHWFELVRLQPRRADGWSNLGLALLRNGEPARAAAALAEAVRWAPADPRRRVDLADAQLELARRALARGDAAGAKKSLAAALAADPQARARAAADPKLAPLLP